MSVIYLKFQVRTFYCQAIDEADGFTQSIYGL